MTSLRTLFLLLAGFILIPSAAAAQASPAKPVVIGYLAAFKGLDATIAAADLSLYTHVNIAFANPGPDGAFLRGDRLACMPGPMGGEVSMASLRAAVRQLQGRGIKVLVSVGGGLLPDCSGDWRALLAPDRRSATVAGLVGLVDALGLDGADIDLEGKLLTEIDTAGNYVPFAAALAAALKPQQRLLTCATASYEGGMIPVASIPSFDLVNIMSYDAIGPSWGKPGSEHASYAMAAADLDLWRARGVPADRLVLGVPFYGYGFGGEAPNWSYRDLAAKWPDRAERGDLIDAACPGCRYVTYNGPATIARKAELAARTAAGVMVWEMSQDTADHALADAIRRGFAAARRAD